MYVPEIEYFFDVPYKFYCGRCKRLMFILRKGYSVDDVKQEYENCPWCGSRINWGGVQDD